MGEGEGAEREEVGGVSQWEGGSRAPARVVSAAAGVGVVERIKVPN